MKIIILILDLDGVLITTPSWKSDKIHEDGYSDFNTQCVANFNKLLMLKNFEIVLSSSRRKVKTLKEFNLIFKNRNIKQNIVDFIPHSSKKLSRKQEIELFIIENKISDFLILDDDKSLNDSTEEIKKKLIQTDYLVGFNDSKLNEAIIKITEEAI